ncbi:amidohydrolase family protein [Algoriphagus sp. H41]|uniref:Amidohydrolase family protein n=1 Tax=Algoriphagus oliviformis TaxID=2811231 RepID=A0ABS3C659_9BACT|nr:amidohydrolase family protein [Algoriphagus oliviformis]MBN7812602.1 amidohydrolase family protein [Algoriphagus oliviformis]
MRLDSHQHFWEYDPKKHEWITPEMSRIRRNFLPADLSPLLQDAKIDGCIAVQADESQRETDFLLDLASQNDWIKGVVGWADLKSDQLDEVLDRYSESKTLVGFREVLQGRDPAYMLQEEFIRGLRKIGQRGYAYDILIFPKHLAATLDLVKKCPDQRYVIDHLAKPYIKDGEWKEWKKAMAPLAERELMHCKLSGMITEADWQKWTPGQLIPYLEIALELFGPERLMYGSDWPVCLLAGEYERYWEVIEQFTSALSPSEKSKIMGDTAAKFYQIP